MPTILSGFLAANLLPIGDGDDKLKLLEEAATDLSQQVKAKPLLAYRFALVGLDSRVPATDPVHNVVDTAIEAKWQTMKNKTGPAPVQIFRAVGLRALEIVATDDPSVRFAVTLIARNRPALGEQDEARDAIRSMLDAFEANTVSEMNQVWVNAVDFSQTKLGSRLKKPGVKEEMAQAFNAETVSAAIQAGLKGYAEDMQEALRETMQSWSDGLNKLSFRDAKSELLWMAASHYSPSAARGLRELEPADLVLYSVLDVSRAVRAFAPPSVEYFLRDLVNDINPQSIKLADLLTEIGPLMTPLAEGQSILTNSPLGPEGRCGWLERAIRTSASPFEQQTGVPADFAATLGEFAVRFYRELQIRKLLEPKP